MKTSYKEGRWWKRPNKEAKIGNRKQTLRKDRRVQTRKQGNKTWSKKIELRQVIIIRRQSLNLCNKDKTGDI